jgi:NNP family nitrate/nitrite transporter-like MFS transporter
MGIGKAAVYKHIPEYFPDNVGSVGGLVGMLGGLGGFFLPPLFAYTKAVVGFPSSTFFVLFLLTASAPSGCTGPSCTDAARAHPSRPTSPEHLENPGRHPTGR